MDQNAPPQRLLIDPDQILGARMPARDWNLLIGDANENIMRRLALLQNLSDQLQGQSANATTAPIGMD